MTVLEANVKESAWVKLIATYKSMIKELPPEIISTYLTQNQTDKTIWRIITIWNSQEALDAMRSSGQTPTGVVIFNKVGANPILSIFDISEYATQKIEFGGPDRI